MKRLLAILLALGLLAAPMSIVIAQDEAAPVAVEEVTPAVDEAPVAVEEPAAPAEEPEATAPEPEPEPIKIPWMVTFFWPLIVTGIVGVMKAIGTRVKDTLPPQLWPIANMLLVAVVTGLQAAPSPQEAIMNVLAAILVAFGFVKTIDFGQGKWSAVKPDLKKKVNEAIAAGVIK